MKSNSFKSKSEIYGKNLWRRATNKQLFTTREVSEFALPKAVKQMGIYFYWILRIKKCHDRKQWYHIAWP